MTAWWLEIAESFCYECGLEREGTVNIQTHHWTCAFCQRGRFVDTWIKT